MLSCCHTSSGGWLVLSMVYSLGPFRLDGATSVLLRDGQPVRLGARGVAVLHALVAQAPQFVSKDRIVDIAWPGLVVEESNLSVQISAIRRALAVVPGTERWLETLPRRGYRYVGPLSEAAPELPPTNLPELLTSFVGRKVEVAEVQGLLEQVRLLTLVGTGGVGKTRLALRAAERRLHAYADGVWLVELGPLADEQLVAQTLAATLGLKEQAGTPLLQTLTEDLRSKQMLLVLDNAEHLVDACARLASTVLQACGQVAILVTSRERLGVAGEQTYRVPSLSLPEAATESKAAALNSDAVQLFIERALLQLPQFKLTDQNAPALAALCRRLDGIPLALELAAGRLRSMTVEEVLQRLDQCFRLLTGGSRTAPRRQQTLRALIDWSYDLLTVAEQTLLPRLSIFAGGWTLEAAEQVCSGDGIERWEMLDLLTSLADKNLVTTEVRNGTTRYGVLESVRQYASELLAPIVRASLACRHLEQFASLGDPPPVQTTGDWQLKHFAKIEGEHDNLRAALAWAASSGGESAERGLHLAGGLWQFWFRHGHYVEGRRHIGALLATTLEEPTVARARALHGDAGLADRQGDLAAAASQCARSLAIYRALDNRSGVAALLRGSGSVARSQGDYALARTLLEEGLEIERSEGSAQGQALILNELANIQLMQGQHAAARALYEESIVILRDLGILAHMAHPLHNLGLVCAYLNDHATARRLLEESLGLYRASGQPNGVASSLNGLGALYIDTGEAESARVLSAEALALARVHGDQSGIAEAQINLGRVAHCTGDLAQARDLIGQGLRILATLGQRSMLLVAVDHLGDVLLAQRDAKCAVPLWSWADAQRQAMSAARQPSTVTHHEASLAKARAAIADDATFERLLHEGQALTLETILDLVRDDHVA